MKEIAEMRYSSFFSTNIAVYSAEHKHSIAIDAHYYLVRRHLISEDHIADMQMIVGHENKCCHRFSLLQVLLRLIPKIAAIDITWYPDRSTVNFMKICVTKNVASVALITIKSSV